MQRPLVSKFLCYLEAAARRELVGTPTRVSSIFLFESSGFQSVSVRRGRAMRVVWTSPEQLSQILSFPPHPFCRQSHPICSQHHFIEIKIPKSTLRKHLFQCQQSRAEGVSNHYQNMIPKPNRLCVSPLVSFSHSLLLGWRQDDAKASGFKVPLSPILQRQVEETYGSYHTY